MTASKKRRLQNPKYPIQNLGYSSNCNNLSRLAGGRTYLAVYFTYQYSEACYVINPIVQSVGHDLAELGAEPENVDGFPPAAFYGIAKI